MGKYFGTDGVRGVANLELTPELAFKIGRCGAYVLTKQAEKPRIFVGRDTRISGEMLEFALIAGMISIGADVVRLGVIPTPGVAYLTRTMKADAGVMISASHNPVEDNGIKFFGSDGFKLLDSTELEIEALMDAEVDELPRPVGSNLGHVTEDTDASQLYANYLKTTVDNRFEGLKIVLDCANGAASLIAPQLFREMGARVITLFAEPNGLNINEGCGSTHLEAIQKAVVQHGADIGLAFDGDADRMLAVNAKGEVVDGDQIMAICAVHAKMSGTLVNNTLVTTVMSNIGLFKALREQGVDAAKTAVGDRYVMEEMRKGGYNLGGEQSGHVIFLDYNTTGDGMLSGLQLVNVIQERNMPLQELASVMQVFPQLLINVRVQDKSKLDGNENIQAAVEEVEALLGQDGRVLIRPSGTEPLIRVMAEGPNKEELEKYVNQIAKVVKAELV